MPARFRIYDDERKGGADRYFVIDSVPCSRLGCECRGHSPTRSALSMNGEPYHPQGIGQHVEIDSASWANACSKRFSNWGKRITLKELPPAAQHAALDFIADCLDKERGDDVRAFLSERPIHEDHLPALSEQPKLLRLLRTVLPKELR